VAHAVVDDQMFAAPFRCLEFGVLVTRPGERKGWTGVLIKSLPLRTQEFIAPLRREGAWKQDEQGASKAKTHDRCLHIVQLGRYIRRPRRLEAAIGCALRLASGSVVNGAGRTLSPRSFGVGV
jgi:hypothetical protein